MALEPRGFLRRQRNRAQQNGGLDTIQRGILSGAGDRVRQIQSNENLTDEQRRNRMQNLRQQTRGLIGQTIGAQSGPSVAEMPDPVDNMPDATPPEGPGPVTDNPTVTGMSRGTIARREDYGPTSVSEIASGIMGQDSPLMERAATEGRQFANRRGLLNSTLAAQASQGAVLDRVLPMAQQEAAQNFQRGMSRQDFEQGRELQERGIAGQGRLSRQEFEQSSALSDQDFQQRYGLTRLEYEQRLLEQERGFGYQSQLSRQEFEQASDLSEQDFEQRFGLTREEYQWRLRLQESDQGWRSGEAALDRELQMDLQSGQLDFQEWQTRFEGRLRERLADMEIGQNERNAFSTAVSNATAAYQTEFQSIMNNTNLSAEQREGFLNEAAARFNAQVGMWEDLYGIDVEWPAPSEGDDDEGPDDPEEPTGGGGGGGTRRNPPNRTGSSGEVVGNWTWVGGEDGNWTRIT